MAAIASRNKFAGEIDTLEILGAMKNQYPIDENRVIVTGFSAWAASLLAHRRPLRRLLGRRLPLRRLR